jgi:hypothetical protein
MFCLIAFEFANPEKGSRTGSMISSYSINYGNHEKGLDTIVSQIKGEYFNKP